MDCGEVTQKPESAEGTAYEGGKHSVRFWTIGASRRAAFGVIKLQGAQGDVENASVVNEPDDAGGLGDQTKRVVVVEVERDAQNLAVQPEEESASWMMDLGVKFTKRGPLVVNQGAETHLLAKACTMLPENQRFLACKIDSVCFNASLPSVLESFVCKVLSEDSYIKGSGDVVYAA